MFSPSGLSIMTGSTTSPSLTGRCEVARLAVDPSRDDGPIIAEEIQAGRGLLGHLLRTHAVANNGDRSA